MWHAVRKTVWHISEYGMHKECYSIDEVVSVVTVVPKLLLLVADKWGQH